MGFFFFVVSSKRLCSLHSLHNYSRNQTRQKAKGEQLWADTSFPRWPALVLPWTVWCITQHAALRNQISACCVAVLAGNWLLHTVLSPPQPPSQKFACVIFPVVESPIATELRERNKYAVDFLVFFLVQSIFSVLSFTFCSVENFIFFLSNRHSIVKYFMGHSRCVLNPWTRRRTVFYSIGWRVQWFTITLVQFNCFLTWDFKKILSLSFNHLSTSSLPEEGRKR